jgi:hypothetical protein
MARTTSGIEPNVLSSLELIAADFLRACWNDRFWRIVLKNSAVEAQGVR